MLARSFYYVVGVFKYCGKFYNDFVFGQSQYIIQIASFMLSLTLQLLFLIFCARRKHCQSLCNYLDIRVVSPVTVCVYICLCNTYILE